MKHRAKNNQIIQIKVMFRRLVKKIFGNLTLYSFLGGSVAFGIDADSSDIDCIVVLRDKAYKDIEIREKVNRFAEGYIKLHYALGRIPDPKFPGDVISASQKEEALAGRGFVNKGEIELPPILKFGDWDKQNVDYRVWLTEIAFGNNTFLTGNLHQFQDDSLRAIDTIVKFLLLLSKNDSISPENLCNEIFKRGKSFLGLSDRYRPVFENLLLEKLKISFARLERLGFVVRSGNNLYLTNTKLIRGWKTDILKTAKEIGAPYFVPWKDLRDNLENFNYSLSKGY